MAGYEREEPSVFELDRGEAWWRRKAASATSPGEESSAEEGSRREEAPDTEKMMAVR